MKPSVFLLLLLVFAACRPGGPENQQLLVLSSGTVERHPDFPSQYATPRTVDVWLPEGYSPDTRYAVLYMHDGQMLFDSTTTWNKQEWGVDETMGRLLGEGRIQPCIVVGIWNTGPGRHSDYYPQKPFESLPAGFRDSLMGVNRNLETPLFANGVQSDNYLKFIVQELKPFIDSTYSTLTDPGHTFIAGSSMGGLISMYALCEYPEVFGGAACLSTHWPGIFSPDTPIPQSFVNYLEERLPDPAVHKLYFDYGTATLDSLYEPSQLLVDAVMVKKGYDATSWITRKFEGKDHSERAWGERLHIPLVFLLSR